MKILVTGSTSLIGQHVVKRLLSRGDQVTVVQRGASSLKEVEEVRCDLSSADEHRLGVSGGTLAKAMHDKDAVVHLAAKVGVAGRWDAYHAMNVEGTRHVINTALHCNVRRFIHISSPSVAHAGKSIIGGAATPADPEHVRGHYARSKAMGETIALAANGDDMKVISLRPHLVWGPGDTQLVQRIIDRAKAGRLVLVGNGQALIDTTYIDNAASAIVAGIDHIEQAAGEALVVSNGQPRTVSEVMHRMLTAAGIEGNLRTVPAGVAVTAGAVIESIWDALDRQEDPPMTRFLAEQLATAHWFDQRKTQRLLNWQPSIGLEEGFGHLASYFHQRANAGASEES